VKPPKIFELRNIGHVLPVLLYFVAILMTGCKVENALEPTGSPTVGMAIDTVVEPVLTITPTMPLIPTSTPAYTPVPSLTTTPTITFTPEPEGCWKPPEDYTRITLENGAVLNRRTLAMLEHAAELYGGELEITGYHITQGSYTTGESASFGTHDGGGAVDLSVMRKGTYTVSWDDVELLIHALRVSGFAAWLRQYGELYPDSPIHIHAIAIGDAELSQPAHDQLTGKFGYFRGFTGVPVTDGPPVLDRHGGPVLCQWMIEMGYMDLR
jgi:hypothetical protein